MSQRTLSYASNKDFAVQTVETCTLWCAARGFNFCGLEYGAECHGDYTLPENVEAQEEDCSMPCAGNSSQICGNGNRLSVYAADGVGKSGPVTNSGFGDWTFRGCYTDSAGERTLSTPQDVEASEAGMTVARCADACGAGGYRFAGLEYADE